jgi:hypothetical protein
MNSSKSTLTSAGKKEALRSVRLKLIGLPPKRPCARACWLQEWSSGQTKTCTANGKSPRRERVVILRVTVQQNRRERGRGFAVRWKLSVVEQIVAIPEQARAGLSVAGLIRQTRIWEPTFYRWKMQKLPRKVWLFSGGHFIRGLTARRLALAAGTVGHKYFQLSVASVRRSYYSQPAIRLRNDDHHVVA